MSLDEARQFMIRHSEAKFPNHPLYFRYLRAQSIVEDHKQSKIGEWAKPTSIKVLDNPRMGRMTRSADLVSVNFRNS